MAPSRRVAAIDCGTNSIRLLIADIPAGPVGARDLVDVRREMVITRLGQGVDRTGALDPEAIERTLSAAREYDEIIRASGASALRVTATSASRDATNRDVFVEGMRDITGVVPQVITGTEEAALSFNGAVSALPANLEAPFLVVDIGGGSTEFVLGTDQVEQAISVDMGSVRVTERFGPEPWTAQKLEAARKWIDSRVEEAASVVDFSAARTVVGVAGTITSLAALIAGVEDYTPELTHGLQPTPAQWEAGLDTMIRDSVENKALQPAMPVGRADVIGGGALVWERVLQHLGILPPSDPGAAEPTSPLPAVVVSEHDILDGLALSLVAQSDPQIQRTD